MDKETLYEQLEKAHNARRAVYAWVHRQDDPLGNESSSQRTLQIISDARERVDAIKGGYPDDELASDAAIDLDQLQQKVIDAN